MGTYDRRGPSVLSPLNINPIDLQKLRLSNQVKKAEGDGKDKIDRIFM